jgi:hypothetical protein
VYGVPTKALNQSVKRNSGKFPADFVFQLTQEEANEWCRSRSQIVTLKRGQNIKYLPYAFTEHGALMAAMVLNSPRAVQVEKVAPRAGAWIETLTSALNNRRAAVAPPRGGID